MRFGQDILGRFIEKRFKESGDSALKEAMYYVKLPQGRVQCALCPHKCVLKNGQRGFCNTRINKDGTCYSLVYGKALVKSSFPIYERSLIYCAIQYNILRIGTAGCNMKCNFCLLWGISQAVPEDLEKNLYSSSYFNRINAVTGASRSVSKAILPLTPQEIIHIAKQGNCRVIIFNINEPTVYYEYMLDIAKLAKKEKMATMFSTNGYINREPLHALLKYIDYVTFGLKGFNDDFYKKYSSAELGPVLETLKALRDEKKSFEIQYVVIPTVNDDLGEARRMCKWIVKTLGDQVPLHLYRYVPSYKLMALPPTPMETMENIKRIAEEEGIQYVYFHFVANFPSPDFEEKIYCPKCKKLILLRKGGMHLLVENVRSGKCVFCGQKISVVTLDE
jgi:pyruvate formate lyase activating enzyme